MSEQRPPLPSWGDTAREVFFAALAANALLSILRGTTDLDEQPFWTPLRIIVSVVFTIAAATWAAAALRRQQQTNGDGPHDPR